MLCSSCSEKIKPVVAIDIDGTMGDYHSHLLVFMCGYFGRALPYGWDGTGNWEDFLGLTQEQYREAKLAFRQGGLKRTMPVFNGAVTLTWVLHRAGAEIWITTTRPWMRLDSVDPDTREWLTRNGFYFDHLLYDEHKYEILANRLDKDRVVAVLDDLEDQCREAAAVLGPEKVFQIIRLHNKASDQQWVRRLPQLADAQKIILGKVKVWNEQRA